MKEIGTIFWRSGVPTRDSLSRRILKVCALSWVEARFWNHKIVFTRSTNTSPVQKWSNTKVNTQILIRVMPNFVKADFWRSDSNITRVELSTLIRPSIQPRIIPDFRLFSSRKAWSSYSPKFDRYLFKAYGNDVKKTFRWRTGWIGMHNAGKADCNLQKKKRKDVGLLLLVHWDQISYSSSVVQIWLFKSLTVKITVGIWIMV